MDGASISPDDYALMRAHEMKREADFQKVIERAARAFGWRIYHTRYSVGSQAGYPDLHLVHPGHRVSIFVELKTQTGKISPAQQTWLDDLRAAGVQAEVWRPIDYFTDRIHEWLNRPEGACVDA